MLAFLCPEKIKNLFLFSLSVNRYTKLVAEKRDTA